MKFPGHTAKPRMMGDGEAVSTCEWTVVTEGDPAALSIDKQDQDTCWSSGKGVLLNPVFFIDTRGRRCQGC